MNEEIETCLARLHTKLDAIAILQAKLDAMEGHIGGLKVSVMNTTEDAMADADARLAEIEKRTPSCSGRGRTHATPQSALIRLGTNDVRAEGSAVAALQRVSRSIDEAERAVVKAVLLEIDANLAHVKRTGSGLRRRVRNGANGLAMPNAGPVGGHE
jgi:hypothetical protein